MTDPIHERGKQMEDLFFKKQDEKLLEQLRAQEEAKEDRQLLASVSGITDESVLDALLGIGVSAETMTCISLIPLVAVAWADKKMEPGEVEAILAAAESVGIPKETPAYVLLVDWLAERPGDDLLDAWKGYVAAVVEKIEPAQATQLRTSVMQRCEEVAKAAGGILGFGNKVSDVEQQVLDELSNAL